MGLLTATYNAGGTMRYNARGLYDVLQVLRLCGELRTFDKLFGVDLAEALKHQTVDLDAQQREEVMWSLLIYDFVRFGGVPKHMRDDCHNFMLNAGVPVSEIQ